MKTLFLFTFAISLTILTVEAKPRGKIIGGEEAPKRKKLIECVVKIITLKHIIAETFYDVKYGSSIITSNGVSRFQK